MVGKGAKYLVPKYIICYSDSKFDFSIYSEHMNQA